MKDRSRREDRGLDKPTGDRVERLLPLPADRIPPGSSVDSTSEKDRNERRDRRERTPDRSRVSSRKSLDRHEHLDRDLDRSDKTRADHTYDRSYDRSNDRHYDRDHDRDRDRDYSALPSRVRDIERRRDDKAYDSPYARSRHEDRRYLDIDDHYNDNSREDHLPLDAREYPDDIRVRRDMWDVRDEHELEREREIDHRYREDSRPPPPLKPREWEADYTEHEWDRNRRGLDWETRDNWDNLDHEHPQLEEEWRHYNRSMDSWPADDRRRWPAEWRERSRPRSSTSHREGNILIASNV